jgi:hypothetical protein
MDPEKISNDELIKKFTTTPARIEKSHKRTIVMTIILLVVLGIAGIAFSKWQTNSGYYTVSQNSIHWHAKLAVYEGAVYVPIPAGVGLDNQVEHPEALHTHADDNLVHMEIKGPVQARKIMIARFMDNWARLPDGQERDYSELVSVTVNGREVKEGLNYVMHDHDEVTIHFR